MARTGPVTLDTSTLALGLAQIRVGEYSAYIDQTIPVLTSTASVGALADTKLTGSVDYWTHESGFPLLEDAVIPLRESQAMEASFEEITPFNLALSRGINPFADLPATILGGVSATTAGTTSGNISANDSGGVTDSWTVVFSSSTAFDVYGKNTGDVGSGTVSAAFEPDNGGNPYFSIPANFFTGTWAAGEVYSFDSTAAVAGTSAYSSVHSGEIHFGNIAAPEYLRMEAVYTFPNGINTLTIIYPYAQVTSNLEMGFASEDNIKIAFTITSKATNNINWSTAPQGKMIFA